MEVQYTHIFFFVTLIMLVLSKCNTTDTMSANQEIKDGDTLVSEGQMFELGFFSPRKSKNQYLGIWYKKISYGTVVWVANRETPITDKSGMLKLSRLGNLVVHGGGNLIVWSSNSTVSVGSDNPLVMLQLQDSGNLVVWSRSESSSNQNLIWQSFDYPTDTFLPGMKFGKDLVTGLLRSMASWKSPDDPAAGMYSTRVDTNGYPQVFEWKDQGLHIRLGPWNGLGFSGYPIERDNQIYSIDFVVNDKEIYQIYTLKSSVVQRMVLTWDGKVKILQWIERIKDWIVYADIIADTCDRFSQCGPYGICSISKHPPCACMKGFEPRNPDEWEASDWVGGCKRKKPLKCGNGDGFWKIKGVKVPDTRRSRYNVSMTLRECEMACKRDCSCTGYANLDIRNGGSGCLIWFYELLDTKVFDTIQDIYVRMDATELEGLVDSRYKKRLLMVLLLTSSALPLIFLVTFAYTKINKRRHMKSQGRKYVHDEENTSLQMEHFDDLYLFSLTEVAKATHDFSAANTIGEGGFGPVYKGVWEDGREIAVKRLSKSSQQGIDEFRNEVSYIAKLQHRNLVKLFGYYETKSLLLDWPHRLNIIHGIARGILYLHQDSCLQIIHRDLKAGNILLDNDMNPKISDFGLARNFVGHDTSVKTKKVVGTYGYISPEYAVHGRFSVKSDVFSFGVLVLEIISGKKNREFSHGEHNDNLLGHAWRLYKDGMSIELMCKSLHASCVVSEVLRSIHVALLCVQHHAEDRPTMFSAVLMLVSEGVLPHPKQPAFFTGDSNIELQSVSSVDENMITELYGR